MVATIAELTRDVRVPDIVGQSVGVRVLDEFGTGTGPFTEVDTARGFMGNGYMNNVKAIAFQASDANATYGKATAVQPLAGRLLLCIRF